MSNKNKNTTRPTRVHVLGDCNETVIAEQSVQFVCHCGRSFDKKMSLAGHKRVHGNMKSLPAADPAVRTPNDTAHKRWSTEEAQLIAKYSWIYRKRARNGMKVFEGLILEGSMRTYPAMSKFMRTVQYLDVESRMFQMYKELQLSRGNLLGRKSAAVPSSDPSLVVVEMIEFLMDENPTGSSAGQWEKDINRICDMVIHGVTNKTVIKKALNEIFSSTLKKHEKKVQDYAEKPRVNPGEHKFHKHDRKRIAYKRARQAWKKSKSKVANDILNGPKLNCAKPSEIQGFTEHWADTFKKDTSGDVSNMKLNRPKYDAWFPVTNEEVRIALQSVSYKTAAGPDGVTIVDLKNIPIQVLCKLYNLFIFLGKVPRSLKRTKTIFIPKKDSANTPRDYRPISMCAVILRLFNKILAKRLVNLASFDDRQRAFRPVDGCAENVMLLEAILHEARTKHRPLYLACLDMANAYGSVSHEAVMEALRLNGACQGMIEYVKDLYTGFKTTLVVGNERKIVEVEKGVLQGDPLSPVLFNMVIDQLLAKIPVELGFELEKGKTVNGMGFADDMNVMSATKKGLQKSLNKMEKHGARWGFRFNDDKCQTLAIESMKIRRHMNVTPDCTFTLNGKPIPTTKLGDAWRYLGAYLTTRGLVPAKDKLVEMLERIRKAKYLKPQDKLYVLRVHLIPRLIYGLCMAELCARDLKSMDRKIRHAMQGKSGFIHLPPKTPVPFYYTAVRDGGLGLMKLRDSIPSMVLHRFGAMTESNCPTLKLAASLDANQCRLRKARLLLASNGDETIGDNARDINAIHREQLLSTMDGRGLKHASDVSYVHQWITDSKINQHLKGGDFCNFIKLRMAALTCRVRAARIGGGSHMCAAGCMAAETNYHQIQQCYRSHFIRIKRHNMVVRIVRKELKKVGYETLLEPCFKTSEGKRFPDVLAMKDGKAHIIDPAIVGDRDNPDRWHDFKVAKYSRHPELAVQVRDTTGCELVSFGACVITYKGIVSKKSSDYLLSLGLSNAALVRAVTATLKGSLLCHWVSHLSNVGKADIDNIEGL
jgi:hypothetical protein